MKKITNRCKYWGQLLFLPMYWLSFLMPRNQNIWLFGSTFGKRFSDNPKYLYLYVSQHSSRASEMVRKSVQKSKAEGQGWKEDENCRDIRPIWISHNKELVDFLQKQGYEVYYYHSLKGIWYALRGKVYLFDNYSKDINFWQSGRALKINLWHGIPLKKIQADNLFDKIRHPDSRLQQLQSIPRRLSDEKPSHYVLTTSAFFKPIFSSAFGTKHVLTSGYPRDDRLVNGKESGIQNVFLLDEQALLERIRQFREIHATGKVVLYMPTFRESETVFFEKIQIAQLQAFLKKNDILFCIKLHPKSKLKEQFNSLSGNSILEIAADTDPYVFLETADVLVTDYSSVYFDFLHLKKPIVFFDYDLDLYLQNSRELYFDYDTFTPGKKVEEEEELQETLLFACQFPEAYMQRYQKERKYVTEKVFGAADTLACPQLVKDIQVILKKA